MARFLKPRSDYQNRSISLPSRSHPSTNTIEVELNKLKSRDGSSRDGESRMQNTKKIINSLSGLMGLFKCLEDFLNLQITKQALSHHKCEKFVTDLQDGFISLLDICASARGFMSLIKENGREIQASLRKRRNGDSDLKTVLSGYTCFRRKIIKDAKKLVSELRQMDNKFGTMPILELDHPGSSVIRFLREVVAATSAVLNSIYLFLCAPISKPKTRWSVVSKLLRKGAVVACENQMDDLNELQSLDTALDRLYRSHSSELKGENKVDETQVSLKSLEISIGEIEDKLECLFRGLIKARANLLNISSTIL